MRRAFFFAAFLISCTSSSGTNDAGADAGGDGGPPPFPGYTGAKCDYAVSPPSSATYVDLALDASEAP